MGYTSKMSLSQMTAQAVFPERNPPYVQFPSRRSVVHSTGGMVACTQPLAAEAGQRILKLGGNAAVSRLKPTLVMESRLRPRTGRCRRNG